MDHDGIECSSTSVTNDNRFQVQPSNSPPGVRDSTSDEARVGRKNLTIELNDGVPSIVNRQPSTSLSNC